MKKNFMFVFLIAYIVFSCDKTTQKTLEDGVDAVKDGLSLFSFRFIDDPPGGIMLKIDIHQSSISKPCDLYKPNGDISKHLPFWFVMIRTGSTKPGVYDVIPLWNESEENRNKAQVLMNYVLDNDSADRYEAVGGSIEIESAPQSIEEWNNGVGLVAKLNVAFPKNAVRTVECEGACMDIDGVASNCRGSCVCEDITGNRTTCELENFKTQTCCISSDKETVALQMTVNAEPCSDMCDWISDYPHLGRYCFELN